MAIIGRIISCDLVIYVFVRPIKIKVLFFNQTREKRWLSNFGHHFEIRLLYTFSSNFILLNQVSGFVGKFSNLKHDILNYNYGCFKYSKEGPYIIIPGIYIPQKIDILIEINNFEEKYFQITLHIYL